MVPESRQPLVLVLLKGGMFKSLLCSVLKSSSQIKKRHLCIEQLRNQSRSLSILSWLGKEGLNFFFFDWCLPLSILDLVFTDLSNNTVYATEIWQDEYFSWSLDHDKKLWISVGTKAPRRNCHFYVWWKVRNLVEDRLPWSFLPLRTHTDAE